MKIALLRTPATALASPQLAASAEALALPGRIGDGEAFVPALQSVRKQMAQQLSAAQARPALLAEQVGAAIWLLHPGLKVDGFRDSPPLTINLNTAEREHLLALPGIDAASAERLLASRRQSGSFAGVDDFLRRAALNASDAQAIRDMEAAARNAGTYPRD